MGHEQIGALMFSTGLISAVAMVLVLKYLENNNATRGGWIPIALFVTAAIGIPFGFVVGLGMYE